MSKKTLVVAGLAAIAALTLVTGCGPAAKSDGSLEQGFAAPPPAARPWVYWFWLNGNITRQGITTDLEAMKRAGIGGVLIMEVDQGAPRGPIAFGCPAWRELFRFVCAEAERLGLEVNMNNDAGWCGSGGPWMTPELSAQKVVWTETAVAGPKRFEGLLPAPEKVAGYYRDIRVLAFPALPAGTDRIDGIRYKIMELPTDFHYGGRSSLLPTRAAWPEPPAGEMIARDKIIDVTDRMDGAGKLVWDAPEGAWTVLRFGYTPTGKENGPAPDSGRGLDCDKMSKEAVETHFAGFLGPLIDAVGARAGKTFVSVHIDSWETNTQNWTKDFAQEFRRLRGYDPLPFLPVLTGRIVGGLAVSERFLWDFRQTISELVLDRYAGRMRELAAARGLRLSIEAYTTCPTDELAYAGRADEPMGEFWPLWFWDGKPYGFGFTCTEMASSAHVYGKNIVGAEAFTSQDEERWRLHPALIKEIGDWAFCEGINRFVFHRFAMQPWPGVRPGMAMGPWGLHYEGTQSWWNLSSAWHEYLSRCQYLLRQGLFTADVCYLTPEGSPISIGLQKRFFALSSDNRDEPRDRTGYNYDLCPPEALLTRMSVKDGRLVLPDGMSYRLLVLPQVETMTVPLLKKIKELVEAGATVVGPKPVNSPGLGGYPACDTEIRSLADALWGTGDAPAQLAERKLGRGRVFWSADIQAKASPTPSPREVLGPARWIWYPEGNPAVAVPPGRRSFQREFALEEGKTIASARLMMHAEDAFTAWMNGRKAGEGFGFRRFESTDIAPLLKPGKNVLLVEATNGGSAPSPAGLIGRIAIRYSDGTGTDIVTDGKWLSATATLAESQGVPKAGTRWVPAKDVGPLGMAPWRGLVPTFAEPDIFAEEEIVAAVMNKLGLPPDFDFQAASGVRSLRYIHRTTPEADIYFVANKLPQPEKALLAFRVKGRRPELWHPDTGRIERPAVYEEADGLMRLPVCFEPSGSVFVVFPKGAKPAKERLRSATLDGKALFSTAWRTPTAALEGGAPKLVESPGIELTINKNGGLEIQSEKDGTLVLERANGRTETVEVRGAAAAIDLAGPWNVRFAPGGGAPDSAVFETLVSWSAHPDKRIAYYSGEATYAKTFALTADEIGGDKRLAIDLGDVQVMAEVKLNEKNLGILWKPPYRVDISAAVLPGSNKLEIKVANLLINRQIGDEFLPEDSDRNPDGTVKAWPKWLLEGKPSPTGRFTFSSWRLWGKKDALRPSGLIGPVRLITATVKTTREK
ncbi:MAG: glycosyl hydrolase [Candidatus Aminicenantes bacterium]|nr:glycosyl hydrolase [Candidatus Aminicenantes bacterium]